MLLGILSDTHGRVAATAAAIDVLRQQSVQRFIHCGDVGGEAIFDLFAGLPLDFVWGNCDSGEPALRRYAESLGLTCRGEFGDLNFDGVAVALTHGDNSNILKQITAARKFKYLLHGHTHVARDQVIDGIRWINPGAIHRTQRPSVAVIDTQTGRVQFIPVQSS